MPSSTHRLDLLRRDIDAIDIAIHDLIVKRATIVEEIGKIKNRGGSALRPGREAAVMRRLAARHHGKFPLRALICVWREMMSAFTHLQEPFSAAVYAPEGQDRLVRLARDHYGSQSSLIPVPTAATAVRMVAEGHANVAVLPLPFDGETESWWPMLMGRDGKIPKVITRLPFLAEGREQALVVGADPRDLSDEESSLIVLELSERTSRSRIVSCLAAAGFNGAAMLSSAESEPTRCLHLIEVPGVVWEDDPRLATLAAQLGGTCVHAFVIGGYAAPLVAPAGV